MQKYPRLCGKSDAILFVVYSRRAVVISARNISLEAGYVWVLRTCSSHWKVAAFLLEGGAFGPAGISFSSFRDSASHK